MRWVCFTLFMCALFLGCSQQARRDSQRLDALLSNRIDLVEFIYPGDKGMVTNAVTGTEAQKLVTSLQRTNRVAASDWSKGQVQHVCLRSGTNEIGWLSLFESGTWSLGEYDFQIRQ